MSYLDPGYEFYRTSELTSQVIRYALFLDRLGVPAQDLCQAVYQFNRLPFSVLRDYDGSLLLADEVEARLSSNGCYISKYYSRSIDAEGRWIYWIWRDEPVGGRLRHKIYVSPALASLGQVLMQVMRTSVSHRVLSFKLGLDLNGVLRSDKLVVYFLDSDSRARFAADLLLNVDGLEAQGVPLSRPLDSSGMVSSAEDPLLGDLSWRQLISTELVDAVTAGRSPEPLEDAIVRVWGELERRGLTSALTRVA